MCFFNYQSVLAFVAWLPLFWQGALIPRMIFSAKKLIVSLQRETFKKSLFEEGRLAFSAGKAGQGDEAHLTQWPTAPLPATWFIYF
jgi:hypothetical protein